MWGILRDRRLGQLKFRRQSAIGIFVADFYCHALKLVIELDGEVHDDPRQVKHDQNRDFYLRTLGCTVLRFEPRVASGPLPARHLRPGTDRGDRRHPPRLGLLIPAGLAQPQQPAGPDPGAGFTRSALLNHRSVDASLLGAVSYGTETLAHRP
jgi:hypothetical protein